jgi:hypothetical protein
VHDQTSIDGVIDTASQVTVLSEEVYAGIKGAPIATEHVWLRGAAKEGRFPAKVVPGLSLGLAPISDNLLIGLDFLLQHQGVIDLNRGELALAGSIIPLRLKRREDDRV